MYYLTKIFEIPMAHRLSKLDGSRCFFCHGHNITIEVTIKSDFLNKQDMVMDFSLLKKIVNELIDTWDHGMFLNETDKDNFGSQCVKHIFNQDPTSEVLCKYLYEKLSEELSKKYNTIFVHSIVMWETRDSKCVYEG
jgi:6-pyruvoyltetrahydropterin/6-carboxytetrahydropterin synthase